MGIPGRKREAGESLEDALRREPPRSYRRASRSAKRVETVRWEYPERTVVIHFYRCRHESGTIEPQESQAMEWVAPERLKEFEFPPADRELIAAFADGRISTISRPHPLPEIQAGLQWIGTDDHAEL